MPALTCNSLLNGLTSTPKNIPFFYLYDKKGSELYESITELEEYYPFLALENLLKQSIDAIVSQMLPQSVVVELGCGTARKTSQILNALVARDGSCRFAGIDVSASFLEEAAQNLRKLVRGMTRSQLTLVEGEYMDGLRRVRQKFPDENLCILWLGSSVGNLTNAEAVEFFKQVEIAAGSNIQILLCTDMWKDQSVLYSAYHDRHGVTEKFIKNGVKNALSSIGYVISNIQEASWAYEVKVNLDLRRVEMWVNFPEGLKLDRHGITLNPNEKILMEVSRKFTIEDIVSLATEAGYCISAAWRNSKYGIQMMLPAVEAMRCSWRDTDELFRRIGDWTVKPIDLRHPFCFYIGHVVAFSKLKMLPHQPPSEMETMFSRGIDPLVLDPSRCHSHPDAPVQWPSKSEILKFVEGCRSSIMAAMVKRQVPMKLLNLSLEHERMHLETLCYMLAQEQKHSFEKCPTRAPPGTARRRPIQEPEILIPAGEVKLGANITDLCFCWDNEGPPTMKHVKSPFFVSSMPVTIAEFLDFVVEEKGYDNPLLWHAEDFEYFRGRGQRAPACWSLVNGEYFVSFPFETKHWSEVADLPVFVSLAEAQAFAKARKGRIMSEAEYGRIRGVEEGRNVLNLADGGWEWTSSIFEPFPGFVPMPMYPQYSTDFFDGQHYVLKGSSPFTHTSLIRESFRNFFQRQYPFVFAKFRLCRDIL